MRTKTLPFIEIMLSIAVLALLGSFLLPRLFELSLNKNEMNAQMNVKMIISPALENYARDNNATYPRSEILLMKSNPPYVNRLYADKIIQGYVYKFDLSSTGYVVEARPYRCGHTGSGRKIYRAKTGGVFEEVGCEKQ